MRLRADTLAQTFMLVSVTTAFAIALWPSVDGSVNAAETPSPRGLTISVGETVRDFMRKNDITLGPRKPHAYPIDADKIGDWAPIIFDDHWIALIAEAGEQSFSLPAGRTLHVSQQSGRIKGFAFRPFAQPRPLPEVRSYVLGLLKELESKGWRATSAIRVPEAPDDFDSSGKSLFAELVSARGDVLQMNLRDYGLAPKSESYILTFNPFHKAAEQSRTYLLQVTLDSPDSQGYGALIYPRRLFVNGDKNAALPLRAWIDDPDWTPEKAGMVEATPEQRAKPDSSFWVMPPGGRP